MTPTLTRSIFGFAKPFDYPFYTGGGAGADPYVPWGKQISINGVGFVIDIAKFKQTTMQIRRLATDDSVEPAEQSLNSTGLWPRAQDNYFLGSGQLFLDNRFAFENVYTNSGEFPSVRTRYWRSKGINPWNEGRLSLHNEYAAKKSSANNNLLLAATDTRLYVSDGVELYWTEDPTDPSPSWTAAGVAAVGGGNNITSLTTTGSFVYAALGAGGIAKTADGGTSASAWSTYEAVLIGYANGHFIASTGRDLIEILADGTYAAGAFHTQPDANFVWTTICPTPTAIIVGGYAGASSVIGAIQPSAASEGATLDPPSTATVLPDGELINSISYSTGLMFLTTSVGVRAGTRPDATGTFDIYPVITDSAGSLCAAAWHEFMYFGWNAYDTADDEVQPSSVLSSGLGRANMSQFQQTNGVPAYATDVMASDGEAANVLSIAVYNGDPYFTVSGSGVWGPSGNKVEQGYYASGWIRYGTTEPKIFVNEKVWHKALLAGQSIDVLVVDEFGVDTEVGSSNIPGTTSPGTAFSGDLKVGDRFMTVLRFNRGTDETQGPTMYYWQANAMVAPRRQDEILLPIILTSKVALYGVDQEFIEQDTLALFLFLKALEADGAPVLLQIGSLAQQAFIDQIQVTPSAMNPDRTWFEVPELMVKCMTLGTGG